MSSGDATIGRLNAKLVADNAEFDAAFKGSEAQMAAAAKAAQLFASKIGEAGKATDAAATKQERALARARAAWQRELVAQDRAAEAATVASRAQEMAALKADILARSQTEVTKSMREVTTAGFDLRHQIGLIDNTIRGAHGMAIADLVRGFSQSKIVMAALPVAMTVAGIALVGEFAASAAEKIAEWNNRMQDAANEMRDFQVAINEVSHGTAEKFLEAQIAADNLRKDHLKAVSDQLKLIDMQTMDDLISTLKKLGSIADQTFDKMDEHWYNFGRAGVGQKAAWDDFQKNYELLVQEGNDKGAAGLLGGTLAQAKEVLKLQGQIRDFNERTMGFGIPTAKQRSRIDRLHEIAPAADESDASIQATQYLVYLLGRYNRDADTHRKTAALQKQNVLGKSDTDIGADARKQAEEAMQALRNALARQQAISPMSAGEVAAFWQKALPQFNSKSPQFAEVLQHVAEAAAQIHRQFQAAVKKAGVTDDKIAALKPPAGYMISKDGTLALAVRDNEALADAIRKADMQQASINASMAAARDKIAVVTGALTPYQAAMNELNRSSESYTLQIQTLQAELDKLRENDALANALGGDQALQAKEAALGSQIAALQGRMKLQQFMDAQNALSETWKGMVDGVWDELVRKSNDAQREMSQTASKFIDGLNTELAKGMTGQRMNFYSLFQSAAQSMAKTSIEQIEGAGMKLLFGTDPRAKLGTRDNPLWTRAADEAAKISSMSLPDLTKIFGSAHPLVSGPGGGMPGSIAGGLLGMLNNSNWFGKLFGGRLFGAGGIFSMLPHFALGGPMETNMPAIVGEDGPEVFMPTSSGRIVPHDRIGVGSGNTWNIDARGTDPALTRENFQRALQATHAQATRDAMHAVSERRRRIPH